MASYWVRGDVDPMIKREIKSICLSSLSLSSSFATSIRDQSECSLKENNDVVKNTNCCIYSLLEQ